jgi:hypothetical protein
MKCLLPALLSLVATAALAGAANPLTVAVFDFQSSEEGLREVGSKVSALVSADLATDARLITVERAELDKALGEQELGLSGTVSQESVAKVGQLTGAKVLVTGRVLKADGDTVIIAKVIGTETSRVFTAKIVMAPNSSLAQTATALARNIGEITEKNAGALVAAVENPAAHIDRINAALGEKKRGTVSVRIPEQHFGRPVIDPAAETELGLILKECGFTVVDEKSKAKPDYTIEGEAFSERSLQRGNLIACKARLEVKVRRTADGEIVAVDRQVGRAVDLAEHIAAKSALQEAARTIAERVVTKAVAL